MENKTKKFLKPIEKIKYIQEMSNKEFWDYIFWNHVSLETLKFHEKNKENFKPTTQIFVGPIDKEIKKDYEEENDFFSNIQNLFFYPLATALQACPVLWLKLKVEKPILFNLYKEEGIGDWEVYIEYLNEVEGFNSEKFLKKYAKNWNYDVFKLIYTKNFFKTALKNNTAKYYKEIFQPSDEEITAIRQMYILLLKLWAIDKDGSVNDETRKEVESISLELRKLTKKWEKITKK